jgi:hypothetical protein
MSPHGDSQIVLAGEIGSDKVVGTGASGLSGEEYVF